MTKCDQTRAALDKRRRDAMTLRVGVNARTFVEREPGGAIQAAKKTTRVLVERDDTDIVLFGHPTIASEFPDTTVVSDYFRWRSQEFGVVWERTVLSRLARKADIDVLYCPNGNAPLTDQPFGVITCIHDVNALKGMSSGIHQLYRKATIPRVARLSDSVVTVSEFSKREIVDKTGISPDDISIVYNGVDDIYHEDGDGQPVDLPENYVLYVGAMNPRKNVSRAVEAFCRFADYTDDKYKFVLVGPGNKRVFKDFNVPKDDRIVTPGYLSQAELKHAYTHADVFLYPSLYEGFGLPPLEAMACGTPVVVSDVASLPEVVGDAGEYVDPFDVAEIVRGIEKVVGDSEYRENLVRAGKERAKSFTWERAGELVYLSLQQVSDAGVSVREV